MQSVRWQFCFAQGGSVISPRGLDQNPGIARLIAMSTSMAEWYRGRAEDCCRNAITAESVERRLHWLEAAARWISFAREEGPFPPRQGRAGDVSNGPP